jgi:hypothetical protein
LIYTYLAALRIPEVASRASILLLLMLLLLLLLFARRQFLT